MPFYYQVKPNFESTVESKLILYLINTNSIQKLNFVDWFRWDMTFIKLTLVYLIKIAATLLMHFKEKGGA